MSTIAPAPDANERAALAAASAKLRRILVHIDDASSAGLRLASARALAGLLDAEVLACYSAMPSVMRHAMQVGLALRGVDRCDEDDYRRSQAAYGAFIQARGQCPDAGWLDLNGEPEEAFEREALYADYLVLQRPDRSSGTSGVSPAFVDHVLVRTGRPAVVLPPNGAIRQVPRTVAIAWTESPAAARAVASAMVLLREAESLHIIGCGEEAYTCVSALAARLEGQGMTPRSHVLEDAVPDVGLSVLDCATRLGADLLVMGGFGHSPARERVLGGASRTALDRSRVALLMAH